VGALKRAKVGQRAALRPHWLLMSPVDMKSLLSLCVFGPRRAWSVVGDWAGSAEPSHLPEETPTYTARAILMLAARGQWKGGHAAEDLCFESYAASYSVRFNRSKARAACDFEDVRRLRSIALFMADCTF